MNSDEDDIRLKKKLRHKPGLPPVTPSECVRDTVCCSVFDQVWSEVVTVLQPLLMKQNTLSSTITLSNKHCILLSTFLQTKGAHFVMEAYLFFVLLSHILIKSQFMNFPCHSAMHRKEALHTSHYRSVTTESYTHAKQRYLHSLSRLVWPHQGLQHLVYPLTMPISLASRRS